MTIKKGHKRQKDFWKLLDKFSPKKTSISSNVPHDALSRHFKSLLNSKSHVDLPPDSNERGQLDYIITLDELKKASVILIPGKALGIDNLSNEIILCLLENHPQVLKLLNSILDHSEIMPDWMVGIITSIHKNGPKAYPSNYRGISLLCCFGKLFLSILNNRLMKFTIENNILSKSQLGFLPGNRTSDHGVLYSTPCSDAHILIHNLARKYCHKNKSRIYSWFIDFSKAFDTIPRDILF